MPKGKHRRRAEKHNREESIATADQIAERERERALREAEAFEQYALIKSLEMQVRELSLRVESATADLRESLHQDIGHLVNDLRVFASSKREDTKRNDRVLRKADTNLIDFKADDLESLLPGDQTITIGVDEHAAQKIPPSAIRTIQRARGVRRPA